MYRIVHGFRITKKRKHKKILGTLLLLFIILISSIIFFSSGDSANILLSNLLLSLSRLVIAYFISLTLAILIAIPVSNTRFGDFMIPVFDLLQNLPSFALIPIFISWLGYTNIMTIVFAATSILWPILFYILHALKTASKDQENAARIFGAKGIKKVLFFSLPVSFPAIITGSIVGFSIGWEAIIGVEIIGLTNGIGSFINNPSHNNNLVLGISALLVIVFLINRLVWMPLLKKSQLYAE